MKKSLLPFALLLLALCSLVGCSSAENIGSVEQSVIVPVRMYVATGTLIPGSPPAGRLIESSGVAPSYMPPTPDLTSVNINGSATTQNGTYNTSLHFSNMSLTNITYQTIRVQLLHLASNQYMRVDLSYDNASCSGNLCPVTAFTTTVVTCPGSDLSMCTY